MDITSTDKIGFEDYVVIMQGGCFRKILYADFIRDIILGGNSICDAWINCVEGIGCINDESPVQDTPPTMSDLIFNISSKATGNKITMQDFLSAYFDADGDKLDKIVIAGGDTNGYTLNGSPINIGDTMKDNDILEYDAKNQDGAYQGILFFKAYDENNIEAV